MSELHNKILISLRLNEASSIHSHHLITREERGSLVELHAVRLKEQSSFSIVRQLPVDRLGNVNIVTTNGLNSSGAISRLDGGVREGAGN